MGTNINWEYTKHELGKPLKPLGINWEYYWQPLSMNWETSIEKHWKHAFDWKTRAN